MRTVSRARQNTPYKTVSQQVGRPLHIKGAVAPPEIHFLLDAEERHRVVYRWLDNAVWDDNLFWVGG